MKTGISWPLIVVGLLLILMAVILNSCDGLAVVVGLSCPFGPFRNRRDKKKQIILPKVKGLSEYEVLQQLNLNDRRRKRSMQMEEDKQPHDIRNMKGKWW